MSAFVTMVAVIVGLAAGKPTLWLGVSSADFCVGYHMTAFGYAAKLAWDRKWPALMPDSPADFNVDVRVVNDMCSAGGNFNGVLDMLQATAGPPVHALVGEMTSPGCESSDRLCAAFATAHVASACVSNSLRDRGVFPTFTTMMAPNFAVTAGVAKLVARLQEQKGEMIRKASIFFTDEPLGWSTMVALQDSLRFNGMGNISLVAIPLVFKVGGPDSQWAESFSKALVVNSHINFLAIQGSLATQVLSAIHNAGITGPNRMWFDCVGSTVPVKNPNFDGMGALFMNSRGPRFKSLLEDFWTTLRPADFASVAGGYYDGNITVGPLAGRPKLTASLFAPNIEPGRYGQETVAHLTFDAVMLFIHMFDRHMKSMAAGNGSDPEVSFRKLSTIQKLMGSMNITGVTGPIIFDQSLDRMGDLSIFNRQGLAFRQIGGATIPALTMTYTGTWLFANGSSEIPALNPAPCPQGSFIDQSTGQCLACPFGTFGGSLDAAQCFSCPPGRSSKNPGSADCDLCEKGYAQPSSGAKSCVACPPGFATGDKGTPECKACLTGGFLSEPGQADCLYCELGSYTDESGKSSCTQCPGGMTTAQKGSRSASDCACPGGEYCEGAYLKCLCRSCPEGMTCPFGAKVQNLPSKGGTGPHPTAKPGYMALEELPLKTYRCVAEENCPGGDAGTCAAHRDTAAVACGQCVHGAYEDDGECRPCDQSVDVLPIPIVLTLVVVGLVLAAVAVNRERASQSSAQITCLALSSLACTFLQTLGVFDQLAFNWADPFASVLGLVKFLCFDVKILKAGCLAPFDPLTYYGLRQAFVPVCVALLFVIMVVRKHFFRPTTVIWVELLNASGVVGTIAFISMVVSCVSPLVCYPHPGSAGSSMRSSSATLCWQGGAHTSMVAICFAVLCGELVPFLALTAWCTYKFAVLVRGPQSKKFLRATSFLFLRFSRHAYYDGLILFAKGLLIALVPVASDTAAVQIMVLSIVLISTLAIQTRLRPLRTEFANFAESASLTALQLLLTAGSLVAASFEEKENTKIIVGLLTVVIFAVIVLLFATAGAAFMVAACRPRAPRYSKFLCHHKAHAAGQARLLKVLMQDRKVTVFIDSDDLYDLDTLFGIVHIDVENLIVYLTRDTLRRPWCAGEVATAMRTPRIKVTTVWTPSFQALRAEDLADLDSYIDTSACDLKVYGLQVGDIRSSFIQLLQPETDRVDLPSNLGGTAKFAILVDSLLNTDRSSRSVGAADAVVAASADAGSIFVSSDPVDDEATAAAGILFYKANILAAQFSDPALLQLSCNNVAFDLGVRAVVIILSVGTLRSSEQLLTMICAGRLRSTTDSKVVGSGGPRWYSTTDSKVAVLPLTLSDFKFPDEEFYKVSLAQVVPSATEECAKAVQAVFKLIAMPMSPHGSDDLLNLQVLNVIRRIPETYVKPPARLTSRVPRPTQPATPRDSRVDPNQANTNTDKTPNDMGDKDNSVYDV